MRADSILGLRSQWNYCWFHGSSFKGFSIVFPAPWLAKVESSQKSNGMWFFRHIFAPFLFHRSKSNRLDKLQSKFWREKMFRKPHLKPLRWFSVHRTNNLTSESTPTSNLGFSWNFGRSTDEYLQIPTGDFSYLLSKVKLWQTLWFARQTRTRDLIKPVWSSFF